MHLAWQIIKQVWGGSAMMPHLHKNCTLALSSDPLISKAWITQFSSRAAGRKRWRKLKKRGLWWLTITQGPAGGAARHVPEQTARGVRTGSVWRRLPAAVSQGSYPAGSLAPENTQGTSNCETQRVQTQNEVCSTLQSPSQKTGEILQRVTGLALPSKQGAELLKKNNMGNLG